MAALPETMPVEEVSKLTDRYQTTVPSGVRKLLRLEKGDRIRYCADASGRVYIEPVREDESSDPALAPFLDLLEADMQRHPERVQVFSEALSNRIESLVTDVDVDLDQPLSPEDE